MMILTIYMGTIGIILLIVASVVAIGSIVKFATTSGKKYKLATPTNLTISPNGSDSLSVSWNGVNKAENYVIQISEDATFVEPVGDPEIPTEGDIKITEPTTSYSIDNLQPGNTRYVRVKAIGKNFLDSDWTTSVNDSTDLGDIYLEAECGSIGNNWEIVSLSSTSGGKYIKPITGNTSSGSAPTDIEDRCSYKFDVLVAGTYRLWIHGDTPNASDDSMWVRLDGGTWVLYNNFQSGVDFHWDEFHDSDNSDTAVDLVLTVGFHTIDIGLRDDEMKLDKLYLTKDGDTPSGISDTAINCVVPADPTGLILTAVSSTQIDLSWTRNSLSSNGTTVEWSPNGTDTWTQLQDAKSQSYSHTGLTTNTTYYYRIREYNETGNSGYLSGNQTTLQLTQLSTPTLTAFSLSTTQLQASWDDITGVDDYRIEFDSDGSFTSPGFSSPTASSYTLGSLSPGDQRYFRVKARATGSIDSEWSNIANATTPGSSGQLSTPINLSASVISSSQIEFDWDNVTNADQYSIDIDDNAAFTSPTNQIVSDPTSIFTFTSLLAGTTYYMRVKAQDTGAIYTDSDYASASATTQSSSPSFNTYYVSPTGTNTNIGTNSRTNPASARFFADGAGYTSLVPGDRVYYRTDLGPYTLTGGFRIYATGTESEPIVYQAEPGGGLAHFRVSRHTNNDWLSLERYQNPNGIFIGGDWYWTNESLGQWNTRLPADSTKGRYCYIIGFAMEGQFKAVTGGEKARDMSQRTDLPYGNTGARAAGTITGEVDGAYDYFSGNMGCSAIGGKIISSLVWHNGQAGSLGFSSTILSGEKESHMNIVVGTGHSGPGGKDRGHNGYFQSRSDSTGYFVNDGNTYIGSCEEQLQCWSQSGVVNTGQPNEYSKVDKLKLIDCIAIHGGGMSGAAYPNRNSRNLLFGGFSWAEDSEIIRFLSYKNPGESGQAMHIGFTLNSNNDHRNLHIQDCHTFSDTVPLFAMNIHSIENVSGNTLVSRVGNPNVQWQVNNGPTNTAFNNSISNISNNSYYSLVNSSSQISRQQYFWNGSAHQLDTSTIYTLATWQSAFPTSEVGSTYTQGTPTNFEKVKNNNYIQYSPAMVKKKTIFNYEGNTTASISVSTSDGLSVGDKYRIVDLQNIAANGIDNFISEHTFVGPTSESQTFTIPDENSGVAGDPTGEMTDYNHSTIEFCHVAIIKVR